jgi:uncharacterized protein
VIETAIIGAVAGVVAGLLGVGGGALFVPALVIIIGLGQVDAEATSLAAMVPVAFIGAWRQYGYGNVRIHDGVVLGLVAIPGAVVGVFLANQLPEVVIRDLFAVVLLYTAFQLVRRTMKADPPPS